MLPEYLLDFELKKSRGDRFELHLLEQVDTFNIA
jgi:hypothetical protein